MAAPFDMDTIRHSAAHIMAAAVQKLYPDARFDIGPSTQDGFYYDFDMTHRLAPEDLAKIEDEMNAIRKAKIKFERIELSRAEAEAFFRGRNQTYKLERLADIPDGETISMYRLGDFTDLCRGPHVDQSAQVGAFKLLSIAGSYFRGKETNPMLQRVYGTAFASREELNAYITQVEEAKKRDHRRLGSELELFSTHEDIGPGLVCWNPKGARIRHVIETFWKAEHYKNGYELVYTPHIGQAKLWQTSGHLDFYREGMYSHMEVDEQEYYVKPMNCPFHIQMYQNRGRSYRELPLRWAELGTVYRYEKSGVLHGLMRVRGFTQDDAHIFCTPEQIEDEICTILRFSLYMWRCFGFTDVKAYLATRPEKAVGEESRWQQATESLQKAVAREGIHCEVDEGGGAFYGPKIDLKVKDAIGREWQVSTIQFDFNLPDRFDLHYVGKDGQRHRPYMVHRALLGSLERFFGILIEHYAGKFPFWLAPEQIRVLPIKEENGEYAKQVLAQLKAQDIRCEIDLEPDPIGAKIKNARNARLPYILVVGDKEQAEGTVAVRKRDVGEMGAMPLAQFLESLKPEMKPEAVLS